MESRLGRVDAPIPSVTDVLRWGKEAFTRWEYAKAYAMNEAGINGRDQNEENLSVP